MEVLFEDNFNGTGGLLSHSADTGHSWANLAGGELFTLGGGSVYRPTGYSTSFSYAQVEQPFYVGANVELLAEIEVVPGSTTGTIEMLAFVGNDDTSMGFSLVVGNNGWCRAGSSGGSSSSSQVLTSGEVAPRTHSIRVVGAVGSTVAELYANGILVGQFNLYASLPNDLRLTFVATPNRSVGYVPLCKAGKLSLIGEGAVAGDFWTKIIRAAEIP